MNLPRAGVVIVYGAHMLRKIQSPEFDSRARRMFFISFRRSFSLPFSIVLYPSNSTSHRGKAPRLLPIIVEKSCQLGGCYRYPFVFEWLHLSRVALRNNVGRARQVFSEKDRFNGTLVKPFVKWFLCSKRCRARPCEQLKSRAGGTKISGNKNMHEEIDKNAQLL